MIKIAFSKTGKSCLKHLNYCANLPRDTCTHNKPHTECNIVFSLLVVQVI